VLGVNPTLPAQSVKELIALAKAFARQVQLRRRLDAVPARRRAVQAAGRPGISRHIPYKGSVAMVDRGGDQ
jgi:hypothetical protein